MKTDVRVYEVIVVALDRITGEVLYDSPVKSQRIETPHELLIGGPNDMTWEECKLAYGDAPEIPLEEPLSGTTTE